MLSPSESAAVKEYFLVHPVLAPRLAHLCVCLTGSRAYGLSDRGADVDVKVLATRTECDAIRRELTAAGRVPEGGALEEALTGVVGDYCLEAVEEVGQRLLGFADLTAVFVYSRLVYLLGDRRLCDDLTSLCRSIPPATLVEEKQRERERLSEGVYAFLRSFQTGDTAGRLLARAALLRSGLRLAFLVENQIPPYDKHLYRLLPTLQGGEQVAKAVDVFLDACGEEEAQLYAEVAAAGDWHEMYVHAAGTPVQLFRDRLQALAGGS